MTDSLLSRLQDAPVGTRELDAEVWAHVNGYELFEHDGAGWRYRMHPDDIVRHERTGYITPYTGSLDAALALAERVCPEWTAWEIRSAGGKTRHVAELSRMHRTEDGEEYAIGRATTPALALCAAIIAAKEGASS